MLENALIKDAVNLAVTRARESYDRNKKKEIIQAYLQGKFSWNIRKEVFLQRYQLFLST